MMIDSNVLRRELLQRLAPADASASLTGQRVTVAGAASPETGLENALHQAIDAVRGAERMGHARALQQLLLWLTDEELRAIGHPRTGR